MLGKSAPFSAYSESKIMRANEQSEDFAWKSRSAANEKQRSRIMLGEMSAIVKLQP